MRLANARQVGLAKRDTALHVVLDDVVDQQLVQGASIAISRRGLSVPQQLPYALPQARTPARAAGELFLARPPVRLPRPIPSGIARELLHERMPFHVVLTVDRLDIRPGSIPLLR